MARYSAQQLADLRAAIATGALRVNTPNMQTEFRSLDDMLKLEAIMAADLAGTVGTNRRTSYASYSKD